MLNNFSNSSLSTHCDNGVHTKDDTVFNSDNVNEHVLVPMQHFSVEHDKFKPTSTSTPKEETDKGDSNDTVNNLHSETKVKNS